MSVNLSPEPQVLFEVMSDQFHTKIEQTRVQRGFPWKEWQESLFGFAAGFILAHGLSDQFIMMLETIKLDDVVEIPREFEGPQK